MNNPNTGISPRFRYVPCVRWKQGEYQAFLHLTDEVKNGILPLIEIPEIGWDFEKQVLKKDLASHLLPYPGRIAKKWSRRPCFLDTQLVLEHGNMPDGDHPLKWLFQRLRNPQPFAIPVASTAMDATAISTVAEIIEKDNLGVALRFDLMTSVNSEKIDKLLNSLRITPEISHFIVDLGAPSFDPFCDFTDMVANSWNQIPYLKRWASVVILSTSFPSSMGGIKKGNCWLLRKEWALYKNLIGLQGTLMRPPIFGDYCISHPRLIQKDMRTLKPSATIRYTTDDAWILCKGEAFRENPDQLHGMSADLVALNYFDKESLGESEIYIKQCAERLVSHGNSTTWRRVGTSRHVEKVASDLSNLLSSSA